LTDQFLANCYGQQFTSQPLAYMYLLYKKMVLSA